MIIKKLPKRRLLAVVGAVLFAIFYLPSSAVRWQTPERSPSIVAGLSPIPSKVTQAVYKDPTEKKSSKTLVSHSTEVSTSTISSLFVEASASRPFSASSHASDLTHPSTSTESPTSVQASVNSRISVSATAVALSSSLVPSAVPEVVDDSHFHVDPTKYRTIFSVSTTDRKFFDINWGHNESYNPTILPHPTQQDKYILVAQLQETWAELERGNYVMECTAGFVDGVLTCSGPPIPLPIVWTPNILCEDETFPGPHDPRVFYGPRGPYILYGSRSAYSCHGMWIQDLHYLLPEFKALTDVEIFHEPTDVQRPLPYREIEKNYFLFWDHENNTYVHQDISPYRIFTSLHVNGSVGPDLALAARDTDEPCLSKYMPKFGLRNATGDGIEYETIHQTTNSLAITLCKRSDPECRPTNDNTFIMVIFQHKSYHAQHAEYFPYVMLFQQTAPFAVHALSTKSIWIHGRTALTQQTPSLVWHFRKEMPTDHTEMFFVASMSWKRSGQMYHGYMDDELFLGFGIEDQVSAGIDILAVDLLQDLEYCTSEGNRVR